MDFVLLQPKRHPELAVYQMRLHLATPQPRVSAPAGSASVAAGGSGETRQHFLVSAEDYGEMFLQCVSAEVQESPASTFSFPLVALVSLSSTSLCQLVALVSCSSTSHPLMAGESVQLTSAPPSTASTPSPRVPPPASSPVAATMD